MMSETKYKIGDKNLSQIFKMLEDEVEDAKKIQNDHPELAEIYEDREQTLKWMIRILNFCKEKV